MAQSRLLGNGTKGARAPFLRGARWQVGFSTLWYRFCEIGAGTVNSLSQTPGLEDGCCANSIRAGIAFVQEWGPRLRAQTSMEKRSRESTVYHGTFEDQAIPRSADF